MAPCTGPARLEQRSGRGFPTPYLARLSAANPEPSSTGPPGSVELIDAGTTHRTTIHIITPPAIDAAASARIPVRLLPRKATMPPAMPAAPKITKPKIAIHSQFMIVPFSCVSTVDTPMLRYRETLAIGQTRDLRYAKWPTL